MAKDLLGQLLIENGFLTEEQLDSALEKQKSNPEHILLGQILVEAGHISQRALDTVLDVQKHRREQAVREEAEEESSGTDSSLTKLDPIVIGEIKREVRQLIKQKIDKLKTELSQEIMEETKRYVRQQVRRVKR